MKRFITVLVALLLSLGSTHVVADPGLAPFDAKYKVKISGLRGEMKMSLAENDGQYTAKSSLRPRGLARLIAHGEVSEHSVFSVDNGILLPRHYESIDTLARDDTASSLDFDFEHKLAMGVNDGVPFELPFQGQVFDRVSIQYALMLGLKAGSGKSDYVMLDGDETKALSVTYEIGPTLRVPYGKFKVRKVQHQAKNSSRITTLWCAEALGFLPVRIEQHKNGKLTVRADLTSYQSIP